MKLSFSFSFSFLLNSMNFVIFLLNFDDILSEFHDELQKIAVILDIFTNFLEKLRQMIEFSGFCEEFHSSVSLFSIHSLANSQIISLLAFQNTYDPFEFFRRTAEHGS